jgi:hypothetical protein
MMLYTVYKTVNLVNGNYYFGTHKTENPDDEYLGSGTYIKRAVAKYGRDKFRKDVLFIYPDAESAFAKEDELIQSYRGSDQLCKNLRKGGSGGFDWINKKLDQQWRKKVGGDTFRRLYKEDPEFVVIAAKNRSMGPKALKFGMSHREFIKTRVQPAGTNAWRGRHHTDEIRKRWSKDRRGTANPMYGMVWFYNSDLRISKRFKAEAAPSDWVRGRRFWK